MNWKKWCVRMAWLLLALMAVYFVGATLMQASRMM